MRGGKREGAGRKKFGQEKLLQKGVSLRPADWDLLSTADARKILSVFGSLLRVFEGSTVDKILDGLRAQALRVPNGEKFFGFFESHAGNSAEISGVKPASTRTKQEKVKEKKPKGKFFDGKFELTPDQKKALRVLESGVSCFITGGAGTGKSTLIKNFFSKAIDDGKRVVLCAPTGVAAYNIGGATIHSIFRIPVQPDIYTPGDVEEIYRGFLTAEEDARNKFQEILFRAQIIIIDEISMCRGDLFEMVMAAIQGILHNPNKKFSKRIQLVFVGDFFQLPPVMLTRKDIVVKSDDGVEKRISEKDRYIKMYGNDSGFAFLSEKWKDIKMCHLTTVIRQKNHEFSTALNKVRVGDAAGFDWIINHCSKDIIDDAVWVCGRNKDVDFRNRVALEKIKNKQYTFEISYNVINRLAISIEDLQSDANRMVRPVINLKVGCKVIAIVNCYNTETGEILFVNGMRGTVVQLMDDGPTVEFENGQTIKVTAYTWDIKRQVIEEKKGKETVKSEVVAQFSQIPLALGYAVTVHKSQGQTISAINVDKHCNFTFGQLYVALSRCTEVEKIYIQKPDLFPLTSAEVKKFYGE